MDGNIVYVPMLKTKRGEFSAVEQLSDIVKSCIKPLFILTTEEAEKRSLSLSDDITKRWGCRPFYIDLNRSDSYAVIQGQSIFNYVLNQLSIAQLNYTPVIDAHYVQPDIINHIIQNNTSVCIRVETNKFCNQTVIDIRNIISNLNGNKIDLLIDYQTEVKADKQAQSFDIEVYYNLICSNFSTVVNNIIIGGSSIPKVLLRADYTPYGTNPRLFWQGYSEFISKNQFNRLPLFSDYSIVYPHEPEALDFMNPNSKIRYSFNDQYLFIVGKTIKDEGHSQNHDLADILVNSGYFMGFNFSWGDSYISDCATKTANCGNMETWIKVGHNHHITLAARQNANLHGFSI